LLVRPFLPTGCKCGALLLLLIICCTPTHTQRPRRYLLGQLYFGWLLAIFVSCIRPLLVSYFALCTSSRVTRQFVPWPQRLTHGTGYLCVRTGE